MHRIISTSELHQKSYSELCGLFNAVSLELRRSKPGTPERRAALASLDNIQRAMAQRLASPYPKPPGL